MCRGWTVWNVSVSHMGAGRSSHGRRGGLEIGCKGAGLSLIRSVPTSRRAGKTFCSSRACMLAAVAAGGYLDDLSATAELMMGKSARGWRWRWSAVCVFPCLPQGIFWSPGLPGPHVLARVVLMDAKSPCLSWCLPRAADNRHVGRPERRCKRAQLSVTVERAQAVDRGVVNGRPICDSRGFGA